MGLWVPVGSLDIGGRVWVYAASMPLDPQLPASDGVPAGAFGYGDLKADVWYLELSENNRGFTRTGNEIISFQQALTGAKIDPADFFSKRITGMALLYLDKTTEPGDHKYLANGRRKLAALIAQYQPKFVIFYGMTTWKKGFVNWGLNRAKWPDDAPTYGAGAPASIYTRKWENGKTTHYVFMPHFAISPKSSHYVSREQFTELAHYLRHGIDSDKAQARQAALQHRRTITPEQRTNQSTAIANHLAQFPLFQTAHTIASYESWDSEPATGALNAELTARGAKVMVPADGLTPGWRWLSAATSGSTVLPPEKLHDAELIILPALRIDSQGNRLGRGGGWYDRMLPHRNEGRSAPGYDGYVPRAVIVALLFDGEFSRDSLLPAQTHDVAVDYVVTPGGIIGPLNQV